VPDEQEVLAARSKGQQEEQKRQRREAAAAPPAGQGSAATAVAVPAASGSLPFSPVTLVFRNVRYFVPNPAAQGKVADGGGCPPAA
jgi:hypothetical protein